MTLYNDTDPFVCRWLRNLIDKGHLPRGDVVETPIEQLNPSDIPDTFHTFAGIGGWALALRMAGWPDDRPVWTGSCPCQPFSSAGKRRGTDDERHLWPAFRGLIAECRPATVFGEQVASKDGRAWLDGVRADLEALGYVVGAADLCAAGVGAPHIRQRLFWVADLPGERRQQHQAADGETEQAGAAQEHVSEHGRCCGVRGGVGNTASDKTLAAEPGQQQLRNSRRQCDGLGNADGQSARGNGEGLCESQAGERVIDGGHADRLRFAGHDNQRMGDAGCARSSQQHGQRIEPEGSAANVWNDCGTVRCVEPTKDGGTVTKYRRAPLEPSLFPLAHGLPGRVGMLRGAGNAIVPQVAAEFVRAFLETRP